ncbi:unnamed protein product [Closterium sp. Yama58-4]|nr:unnamed protein product [Closterium sp. Yama58-4]
MACFALASRWLPQAGASLSVICNSKFLVGAGSDVRVEASAAVVLRMRGAAMARKFYRQLQGSAKKRRGQTKFRHPSRPLYHIHLLLSCATIAVAACAESPSTPSTSIKSAYNAADHLRDLPVRVIPHTSRSSFRLDPTAWRGLHLNRTRSTASHPRDPPVRGIPHTRRSAFSLDASAWRRLHLNRTLRSRVNSIHSPLRRINGRSFRSSNSSFVCPRRVMQARLKQPFTSDPTAVRPRPSNIAPTATRSPSQLPVIPSDLGPQIMSFCGQGVCAKDPKWCGVMNNPIRVYLVWYGSFSDTQKSLLRTFIHSLSSTEGTVADWWRTNTLYYDCSGRHVSSSVALAREHHVRRPLRLLYGLKSIKRVVKKRMNSGAFPVDEDGVYFVIGDGSVAQVCAV